MQKRALAVHDISCVGRCSLTVALPILSAAGVDTSVIPTALLSTHTGEFTGYTHLDLTDQLEPIARHIATLGLHFDAFYTGYLASARQTSIVLSMALAVVALRNKEIERIVLTRPAVEAGEKLGFLPGDLNQKVDPYLRPLYDALYDMMGPDSYLRLQERGILEVAPLAYMRGRTLSESFIILDEAQNTTPEQMKMFLTRFGAGSRVVVTGDDTQTDLPTGKLSGLLQAVDVLKEIPEIAIVRLTHSDVVRHDLVQTVVKAYESYERDRTGRPAGQ